MYQQFVVRHIRMAQSPCESLWDPSRNSNQTYFISTLRCCTSNRAQFLKVRNPAKCWAFLPIYRWVYSTISKLAIVFFLCFSKPKANKVAITRRVLLRIVPGENLTKQDTIFDVLQKNLHHSIIIMFLSRESEDLFYCLWKITIFPDWSKSILIISWVLISLTLRGVSMAWPVARMVTNL